MSAWLPISSVEMAAWSHLTGNIVRSEEWQIMRDMDVTYLRATSSDDKSAPIPDQEITTTAFDAVFG